MAFVWPDTQRHTLLLGSNGSGKSIFALHMLSNAPIKRMPWIILDYKGEELANSIPYVRYIDFKDKPKEPGVYILPANISSDDHNVEEFLKGVHRRERTGLLFDEAYMIPHLRPFKALNTIYTQGRSKHIQTISLSQRPSWISRYAYSEASYIGYMRLNDRRDRKTVAEFVPPVPFWNLDVHPPKYHVKWYDTIQNESMLLAPAPSPDTILQTFEDRLRVQRKVYM